jgi:hypothetical protein
LLSAITLSAIDPDAFCSRIYKTPMASALPATYNPHSKRRHQRFSSTDFIRHAVARRIKTQHVMFLYDT